MNNQVGLYDNLTNLVSETHEVPSVMRRNIDDEESTFIYDFEEIYG